MYVHCQNTGSSTQMGERHQDGQVSDYLLMIPRVMLRCNGYCCVGLAISRSQVPLLAVPLSCNDSGQVVHTHVPLSPTVYNSVGVEGSE